MPCSMSQLFAMYLFERTLCMCAGTRIPIRCMPWHPFLHVASHCGVAGQCFSNFRGMRQDHFPCRFAFKFLVSEMLIIQAHIRWPLVVLLHTSTSCILEGHHVMLVQSRKQWRKRCSEQAAAKLIFGMTGSNAWVAHANSIQA